LISVVSASTGVVSVAAIAVAARPFSSIFISSLLLGNK
jgi:hypothetical protein